MTKVVPGQVRECRMEQQKPFPYIVLKVEDDSSTLVFDLERKQKFFWSTYIVERDRLL